MKNIAVVSNSFKAYSETFIQAQVDRLPASLFLYGGSPKNRIDLPLPNYFKDDFLPTHYNENLIISPFRNKANLFSNLLIGKNIFSYGNALSKILKQHKIELILAEYGPIGVAILPFAKKLGIPLVVHFHGYDASHEDTLTSYKSRYAEMFDYSRAIVVVSKAMKNRLLQLGCPEEKLHLITYGPNPIYHNVSPKFDSNTFFSIGRFVNKKAPFLTLMAFSQVAKEYPEARIRMAGSGPLLNACIILTRSLKIEDKVEFLGIINSEEITSEFENALAYVQHSVVSPCGDSEGTPLAILESSAAGLPVLSTYHAGIPDVIEHEKTGLLVEEGDVNGMAEAMKSMLKDKTKAEKLGSNGKTRILENFTMDKYIDRLRRATKTTRLLAVLVNFGNEQLHYLKQVTKSLKSFKHYEVTVIVNSNIHIDDSNIDELNILKLNNFQHLPLTCRKTIWDKRSDYDIFLYSENDHLFLENHIDKHLEYSRILPPDRIPGLIQYEENQAGRFYPAYHDHFDWDFESVEEYGGKKFAAFSNLHQASFILTKDQLIRAGERFDFTDFYEKNTVLPYSEKCKANTDVYLYGGMKKVICISEFNDNLIHHLPNLYIDGDKGRNTNQRSGEERMENSLARLLKQRPITEQVGS